MRRCFGRLMPVLRKIICEPVSPIKSADSSAAKVRIRSCCKIRRAAHGRLFGHEMASSPAASMVVHMMVAIQAVHGHVVVVVGGVVQVLPGPGDGPGQPGELAQIGHHGWAFQRLLERSNIPEGDQKQDYDALLVPDWNDLLLEPDPMGVFAVV